MKFVSIVGDSISAYASFLPDGYMPYYTDWTFSENDMHSVYDMWWAKVNQHLRAYLCVCNAYSGSRVSGELFPSMASAERTRALHTEKYTPDVILIYGGFNDFGGLVPIEGADGFRAGYQTMLQRLRGNYPHAKIVCGTLMKTALKGNPSWSFPRNLGGAGFDEYNAVIRQSAVRCGCYLADVGGMDARYEALDGTHPTAAGHAQLAQCWCTALDRVL